MWYIVKYFSNSGKTLIILANNGIWPFWPKYYSKISSKLADCFFAESAKSTVNKNLCVVLTLC